MLFHQTIQIFSLNLDWNKYVINILNLDLFLKLLGRKIKWSRIYIHSHIVIIILIYRHIYNNFYNTSIEKYYMNLAIYKRLNLYINQVKIKQYEIIIG